MKKPSYAELENELRVTAAESLKHFYSMIEARTELKAAQSEIATLKRNYEHDGRTIDMLADALQLTQAALAEARNPKVQDYNPALAV